MSRSRGSVWRTTWTWWRRLGTWGQETSSLLVRRTLEIWWWGTWSISPASDTSEWCNPVKMDWTYQEYCQGPHGHQGVRQSRVVQWHNQAQESWITQTEILWGGQSLPLLCLGLLHRDHHHDRASDPTSGLISSSTFSVIWISLFPLSICLWLDDIQQLNQLRGSY